MRRASVSEFPNDNPLLHHGAIWVLETPCGALESIPPDDVAEPDADDDTPVDGLLPSHVIDGPLPSHVMEAMDAPADVIALDDDDAAVAIPAPPAAAADPFDDFVRAMVSVAAHEDETAALVLPRLLEPGSIDDIEPALAAAAVAALSAGGWLDRSEPVLCPSDRLRGLVRVWQNVLRTGDFSECGESMLNEWGAELLAALLASPQRAQALSYELRRRGVAAFGMVKLAA